MTLIITVSVAGLVDPKFYRPTRRPYSTSGIRLFSLLKQPSRLGLGLGLRSRNEERRAAGGRRHCSANISYYVIEEW